MLNYHESPWHLWNLKVHSCVYKSLWLVPYPSQKNPVYFLPPFSLRSIFLSRSHPHLGLQIGLFLWDFWTQPLRSLLRPSWGRYPDNGGITTQKTAGIRLCHENLKSNFIYFINGFCFFGFYRHFVLNVYRSLSRWPDLDLSFHKLRKHSRDRTVFYNGQPTKKLLEKLHLGLMIFYCYSHLT